MNKIPIGTSVKNFILILLLFIIVCICIIVVLYTLKCFPKDEPSNIMASTAIEVNLVQNFDSILQKHISKSEKISKNINVKQKLHVPKYMLDLYEGSKYSFYDDLLMKKGNVADVVKSIIPKNAGSIYESRLHLGENLENSHLLIFEVPFSNEDETFINAELRILTLVQQMSGSNIGVERVVHVSYYDDIDKKIIKLEQKHVYHTNNTWISFNMTLAVTHLIFTKNPILKIVITLQSILRNNGNLEISLLPMKSNDIEHDYPLLLLSYATPKKNGKDSQMFNRTKRNTDNNLLTLRYFDEIFNRDKNIIKFTREVTRDKNKNESKYVRNQTGLDDNYKMIELEGNNGRKIKDNNKDLESTSNYNNSNTYEGDNTFKRLKRNVDVEEYEEESNNIWDDDSSTMSKAAIKKQKRLRNLCRKRSMYVDFAKISYDNWIIQPSGYEAYQCVGKCFYPIAEHLSPTKHAVIQSLVHSATHHVNRACCTPTRLGSISILYVDSLGVLTYRLAYNDMVVLECGCR